eukprot:scaffold7328_cov314-Pinguiococcus_pyrenoidosus.AAC.19
MAESWRDREKKSQRKELTNAFQLLSHCIASHCIAFDVHCAYPGNKRLMGEALVYATSPRRAGLLLWYSGRRESSPRGSCYPDPGMLVVAPGSHGHRASTVRIRPAHAQRGLRGSPETTKSIRPKPSGSGSKMRSSTKQRTSLSCAFLHGGHPLRRLLLRRALEFPDARGFHRTGDGEDKRIVLVVLVGGLPDRGAFQKDHPARLGRVVRRAPVVRESRVDVHDQDAPAPDPVAAERTQLQEEALEHAPFYLDRSARVAVFRLGRFRGVRVLHRLPAALASCLALSKLDGGVGRVDDAAVVIRVEAAETLPRARAIPEMLDVRVLIRAR